MNDPVAGLVVVGGTLICMGLAWCAEHAGSLVGHRGVAKTAVASGRSLGRAAAAPRPLECFATPRGRTSRMEGRESLLGRSSTLAAPARNLTAAPVRDRRAPRTTAPLAPSAEVHRGAVRQTASCDAGPEARPAAQVSSPRRPSSSDGVRLPVEAVSAGRWWDGRGGRLTTAHQLSGQYGLPGAHTPGASIPSHGSSLPRRAVLSPESKQGAASWTAARGIPTAPRAASLPARAQS